MNYFLVGNGFDLHHKFPTSYLSFLNTLKFLIENDNTSFETVGQVFGNNELQSNDKFIKECYEKHNEIYNNTTLPKDKISNIILKAKNNMWFKYLCVCVSKNIKWIDFENEIIRVIGAFESFFNYTDQLSLSNDRVIFNPSEFPTDIVEQCILSHFNCFFEKATDTYSSSMNFMYVKDEYVIEQLAGSKSYDIAVDKIVSYLYSSLRELADILRDYLLCFIDKPLNEYKEKGIKPRFLSLPTPNRVYSFNYTNTIEVLYDNSIVEHIHGNTISNIVLGINPDKNDNIESINTTFLQFKKYFQRVFFNTDIDFINKIRFEKKTRRGNDNTLYVIGHSLDSTDEDVIKQIFDISNSIRILYHSDVSVKNQIKNLVKIYGKDGLDKLREEKSLVFLLQSDIEWRATENT